MGQIREGATIGSACFLRGCLRSKFFGWNQQRRDNAARK